MLEDAGLDLIAEAVIEEGSSGPWLSTGTRTYSANRWVVLRRDGTSVVEILDTESTALESSCAGLFPALPS